VLRRSSSDSDTQEVLFLSSLESTRFEPVRNCVLVRRLRFDSGKECALVRLDPPVIGQDFDSAEDIDLFLVTPRHEGARLFPVSEFPLFVFIGLPSEDVVGADVVTAKDVVVIGWGELYRTAEDAREHRFG
jgi:hypothetical protein